MSTTWYVVVEVRRSDHKIFPYNDYRGIATMTTNRQEALDKEKELDNRGDGTVGIVEVMEVMNA